jgi:hypothetical protein
MIVHIITKLVRDNQIGFLDDAYYRYGTGTGTDGTYV